MVVQPYKVQDEKLVTIAMLTVIQESRLQFTDMSKPLVSPHHFTERGGWASYLC